MGFKTRDGTMMRVQCNRTTKSTRTILSYEVWRASWIAYQVIWFDHLSTNELVTVIENLCSYLFAASAEVTIVLEVIAVRMNLKDCWQYTALQLLGS